MKITVQILQAWYNEFNESMFNGLLLPVDIVITRKKTQLGCVARFKNTNKVLFLAVSSFLDRDDQGYKDTLAHEMIHVFQVQNNLPLKHDKFFHSECDRINKSFPSFSLSEKADIMTVKTNKNIKYTQMMSDLGFCDIIPVIISIFINCSIHIFFLI